MSFADRAEYWLEDDMAWAIPSYTKNQVDAAGELLIANIVPPIEKNWTDWTNEERDQWDRYGDALTVINNWRASHSFPLNTFRTTLARKADQIDSESLIAQRIKRLSSIRLKLERFKTMKLSQMQDIGGCRAVLKSVEHVDRLIGLYEKSDIKHKPDRPADYIRQPKRSGYRGVHLIYRYYSDRKETYNGLRIEMQLRSNLQHAWATAVETVGTFIRQALKSSQGEEEWLRFFALMGSAIAVREGTPLVPDTPTGTDLVRELRGLAETLNVQRRLRAFGAALQVSEDPSSVSRDAKYYLLKLDPTAERVTVVGFKGSELDKAAKEYLETERGSGVDAVLVSVDSLAALRRAYPNYFLDTGVFIETVNEALGTHD